MNPAKGTADYELTNEAARAERSAEMVNEAMQVQTEMIFKTIVGDKLTVDEMKQLKLQIIQAVTPTIEA